MSACSGFGSWCCSRLDARLVLLVRCCLRRCTAGVVGCWLSVVSAWPGLVLCWCVLPPLLDKVANAKCLGMPRAQGEIILVTDASNVGGGGTLFQWQALEKEEFDSAISQWGTEGLNRDGTLKHSYPDDKWVLVPLGHWNWKWNQARGNYSTYEQELLAGMLVLSSQARLLGSNPVVWLCD